MEKIVELLEIKLTSRHYFKNNKDHFHGFYKQYYDTINGILFQHCYYNNDVIINIDFTYNFDGTRRWIKTYKDELNGIGIEFEYE